MISEPHYCLLVPRCASSVVGRCFRSVQSWRFGSDLGHDCSLDRPEALDGGRVVTRGATGRGAQIFNHVPGNCNLRHRKMVTMTRGEGNGKVVPTELIYGTVRHIYLRLRLIARPARLGSDVLLHL